MYFRRLFKKLKIKLLTNLDQQTGIELRHVDNAVKDRSYANAEITRKFQNIEKDRLDEMKNVLSRKDNVKQLLDDKIVKIHRLDIA